MDKYKESGHGKGQKEMKYPDTKSEAFELHEAAGAIAAPFSVTGLIERIRQGLPFAELDSLRASLDVPMDKLAGWLGISKATLHRRKKDGKLAAEESDRVVRFARLFEKAIDVMEGDENARRWMSSPQAGLGGAVPLEFAETEVGAREVEDLLGRIEHGVYS